LQLHWVSPDSETKGRKPSVICASSSKIIITTSGSLS